MKTAMTHEQIKAELDGRGYSFALLADALEVSPAMIGQVARRKAKSRRCALALAKAIGKPIDEVFGDVSDYIEPQPNAADTRARRIHDLRRCLQIA